VIETLHRLAAVWGPSGREQKMTAVITDALTPLVDEVWSDRYGNVIGKRKGRPGGHKVMLISHMDTSGALAFNITETGLIYLAPIGGLKVHHAIGQRVVWGGGAVGVIQHEPTDEPRDLDFRKLWCDIGAATKDEVMDSLRVGDMCTLSGDLQQMGDLLCGPGLDNRAGCTALLAVAEHLDSSAHEVYFAFTCQGQVSARGAGPAAFGIDPAIAFVLDFAAGGDGPKAAKSHAKLGKGPAIKLKESNFMAHQGLADLIQTVADQHSIPLQVVVGGAEPAQTEGLVVSIAHGGVRVGLIEIPGRYRGTAGEMVNIRDLHGTVDLLLKLLSDPLDLT